MKRTVVTYICDLCGREFSKQHEVTSCQIPVFAIPVDEYGRRDEGKTEFLSYDLCADCIDRVAVVETYVGICCPVEGEGKLRWRKRCEANDE